MGLHFQALSDEKGKQQTHWTSNLSPNHKSLLSSNLPQVLTCALPLVSTRCFSKTPLSSLMDSLPLESLGFGRPRLQKIGKSKLWQLKQQWLQFWELFNTESTDTAARLAKQASFIKQLMAEQRRHILCVGDGWNWTHTVWVTCDWTPLLP